VVGDGEARGVLGLGPLAERGEHAPDEAALVPAEVEPGDRGGGGREEHRGEEDDDRAARHRGEGREPTTTTSWLVGWFGVGVWRLAALRSALVLPRARFASDGGGRGWGLVGEEGKRRGNRVVGAGWSGGGQRRVIPSEPSALWDRAVGDDKGSPTRRSACRFSAPFSTLWALALFSLP